MDREIEIQIQVEKPDNLLAFLKEKAVFKYKNHQIDQYFVPAHRDFTERKPIAEWFRLRKSAGKASVTYKHWYYDESGRSTHCDEYETDLADADQFMKILKALDFKPVVNVDKVREVYSYNDYEIAMDRVKDLGDFIEIEYKGNKDKDPIEITNEMIKFLKTHEVGKICRNYRGYSYSLLFPKDSKLEEY